MNRNESFPATLFNTLEVHLAWATLELMVDDVEELQVLISGDESDVNDLKVSCEDGRLLVEQPTYGLSIKIAAERWMQIFLRIPRAWKGALNISTISGPLKARGLTGTDINLETVSGDLRANTLSGIDIGLKSVTGNISAGGLDCEKLALRSVSGTVNIQASGFQSLKFSGVSGAQTVEVTRPFEQVEGTTVAGDVKLYAPMDKVDAVLRAVTGRVRTGGVSIVADAPPVHVTSVSGDLMIDNTLEG